MMCASYRHADTLDRQAIEHLLVAPEGPCISFFLPIYSRGSHEVPTEPLRLKRLLETAEHQLAMQGLGTAQIESFLTPVSALTEPNKEYWLQQSEGLALFVTPGVFQSYWVTFPIPERVVVDRRFAITPLLPILAGEETFFLLALSQNAVRFFQGNRDQLTAVALPDAPASLAEALRYDEAERSLQLHSTGSATRPGRRPAVFHGQGVAGDEAIVRSNLRRYLQAVARAVAAHLATEKAPLVLAGVDVDQGLYRQVADNPQLLAQGIPGNPDRVSEKALHASAWQLVAGHFQQAKADAVARYQQLAGQDDGRTVDKLSEVLRAAIYQAVDTLLISNTEPIWGRWVAAESQVLIHEQANPGDEDLVNWAVVQTLNNRGAVYQVEPAQLPATAVLAAILRR